MVLSAYRAAGAELPLGDPSRGRGTNLEGWFWRLTDADGGRVVVVLAAVARVPGGPPWGLVALAGHPGGVVRSAVAAQAHADPHGPGLRVGGLLQAAADRLRVDLGPDARLDVELRDRVGWPARRALGGLGPAQVLPGLSQYWHPHLLRASVRGEARLGGERWLLDGAAGYAEKNWGPGGMPDSWWWGQAHAFDGDEVTVAFAGGPARWGPVRTTGTALVVALGDELLRFVRPLQPIAVAVDARGWRLRAGGARHRVEVEATAGTAPVLLPIPVPGERRHIDAASPQHLAGTLRLRVQRGRRLLYAGESRLAGLERGRGLERAPVGP